MKRFYLLVEECGFFPQAVGKSQENIGTEIFPQTVDKFKMPLFFMPWGLIRIIIDKFGSDSERAILEYVDKHSC